MSEQMKKPIVRTWGLGLVSACACATAGFGVCASLAPLWPENRLVSIVWIIYAFAGMIGGAISGSFHRKHGWFVGGSTGMLYGACTWAIGQTLYAPMGSWLHIGGIVLCAWLSGTLGGMIGVGLRRSPSPQ